MAHKRKEWTSCTIKRVHHNFWTVMQHCISLQKISTGPHLHAYPCRYCNGIHVSTGRTHNIKKLRKYLDTSLRIIGNPEWWDKAPSFVIKRRIDLEISLVKQFQDYKENNETSIS